MLNIRYQYKPFNYFIIYIFILCYFVSCTTVKSHSQQDNLYVIIASGHVEKPHNKCDSKGALSHNNIYEYKFNDSIVKLFEQYENRLDFVIYDLIYATENFGLKERVKYVNQSKPDLYIEIHHDSAQIKDIKKANQEGINSKLWNHIKGFSLHYSEMNKSSFESKIFSSILANHLKKIENFIPNLYHADYEKMICIDRSLGLYNRIKPNGLYVLYNIKSPSIVVECGTIVNPTEEIMLNKLSIKQQIVRAINESIYCTKILLINNRKYKPIKYQ